MTDLGSDGTESREMSRDETPVGGTVAATLQRRIFKAPKWWRRGGWRRAFGCVAVFLSLIIAYFAISLFQVWSTGRSHHDGQVDAIVVMGAAHCDVIDNIGQQEHRRTISTKQHEVFNGFVGKFDTTTH